MNSRRWLLMAAVLSSSACDRNYNTMMTDAALPDARVIADGGSSDSASDAESVDAGQSYTGWVQYLQRSSGVEFKARFGTFSDASYFSEVWESCSSTVVGDCVIKQCTASGPAESTVTAGEIAISRGGQILLSSTTGEGSSSSPLFAFGDALLVSAVTADVPGWSVMMNWPPPPELDIPSTVSREAGGTVTWSLPNTGGASRVGVRFVGGSVEAVCDAPGSAAMINVPPQVFAAFEGQTQIEAISRTRNFIVSSSGNLVYRVVFTHEGDSLPIMIN